MSAATPPVLVVMGVAGVGKTTLGLALAGQLRWPFIDGDALHPPANIAKMAAGQPLDDADRAPWLAAIADWIDARAAEGQPGVVTCSALKRAYRDYINRARPQVTLVYLRADPTLVAERMAARKGHFMPPSLLASQFADLEPPGPDEPVIEVDARLPVHEQVDFVVRQMQVRSAAPAPTGARPPS